MGMGMDNADCLLGMYGSLGGGRGRGGYSHAEAGKCFDADRLREGGKKSS